MSSEAYAERCRGTSVYLLLDEEIGIPEQCIWNSEEKEAIQRGTDKIEKVIEITFKAGTITEKLRKNIRLRKVNHVMTIPAGMGKGIPLARHLFQVGSLQSPVQLQLWV